MIREKAKVEDIFESKRDDTGSTGVVAHIQLDNHGEAIVVYAKDFNLLVSRVTTIIVAFNGDK